MQIMEIYWMIIGILIMTRAMITRVIVLVVENVNNLKHYVKQLNDIQSIIGQLVPV